MKTVTGIGFQLKSTIGVGFEVIKLVLVIEGETYSEKELEALQAEMKIHFNKYELPKEIRFLREFAETESGKVRRKY